MMKRFYITGSKGSYCECSDGIFADTVQNQEHDLLLIALLNRDATDVDGPLLTTWNATELAYYVGALPETLTVEQCAQLAHISIRGINRAIERQYLSATRRGGKDNAAWDVALVDFEDWLDWRGRQGTNLRRWSSPLSSPPLPKEVE